MAKQAMDQIMETEKQAEQIVRQAKEEADTIFKQAKEDSVKIVENSRLKAEKDGNVLFEKAKADMKAKEKEIAAAYEKQSMELTKSVSSKRESVKKRAIQYLFPVK